MQLTSNSQFAIIWVLCNEYLYEPQYNETALQKKAAERLEVLVSQYFLLRDKYQRTVINWHSSKGYELLGKFEDSCREAAKQIPWSRDLQVTPEFIRLETTCKRALIAAEKEILFDVIRNKS